MQLSENLQQFLKLLFEPSEKTCFSSNAKGTQVRKLMQGDVFLCINALHPTKDLNPTEPYHKSYKPRRADCNVMSYRNFLIEIDNMPLDEQLKLVEDLKLPVSAITYSGAKSYHFIISLETPLQSIEEYKNLANRLHAFIPQADPSTKNPSRFSRIPTAHRRDTNKEQSLIMLNSRVKFETLNALLPQVEQYTSKEYAGFQISENGQNLLPVQILEACYNPDDVMLEKNIQGRNQFFFWLGNRLKEVDLNYDAKINLVERAYENLRNTNNFSILEAFLAARVK